MLAGLRTAAVHSRARVRSRALITARGVLDLKEAHRPVAQGIDGARPLFEAMREMVTSGVGSLIVVDGAEEAVTGLITQMDLVRHLARAEDPRADHVWSVPVRDIQTPADRLVFVSPDESLAGMRELMCEARVRHLPVMEDGRLVGIVSLKDLMTTTHRLAVGGGGGVGDKHAEMTKVHGRRGIGRVQAPSALKGAPLAFQHAAVARPHPRKDRGEDAWMTAATPAPLARQVLAVADGVGSWFEQGVDPSAYSAALMDELRQVVEAWPTEDPAAALPSRMLELAWERVLERAELQGSATACVVALDAEHHELVAANVGDSGFVILRPAGAAGGAAGTLEAPGPGSGVRVSFKSPQQLHYFNCPFQLGQTTARDRSFSEPRDAQLLRVPVREGDIVVLATDGLFDNVHEHQLVEAVGEDPDADEADIAERLAQLAFDLSVDKDQDSPFALLAKDNDIMWGGGIPDDITIVVARFVPLPWSGGGGGLPAAAWS